MKQHEIHNYSYVVAVLSYKTKNVINKTESVQSAPLVLRGRLPRTKRILNSNNLFFQRKQKTFFFFKPKVVKINETELSYQESQCLLQIYVALILHKKLITNKLCNTSFFFFLHFNIQGHNLQSMCRQINVTKKQVFRNIQFEFF